MGGHEGDDFLALSGLVKGSNYNFVDPNTGLTPLLNASIHGKLAIVRVLIDRGADVEFKERGKLRNALMLAAKNGHDEVVEHLLYRGATVNSKALQIFSKFHVIMI
jgi:ankyrin repeat protein